MNQSFRVLAAAALAASPLLADAVEAAYPERPVTVIVPFPAGGRTDLTARMVAQHLEKNLGTAVPVVNKAGAGGVVGAKEVAKARPDGYTLGIFSSAVVSAQYTVETPTSLADYEVIGLVEVSPAAVAVKYDAPWKTLKDLAAHAKRNPNKLRLGMIPGASAQVFAGGFVDAAGVTMTMVPFKGDADGATALAGGHIEVHVAVPVSYKTFAEAKKVRILGVAAERRSALDPDVPTFRENGLDLVIGSFHIVFAPKGTPAPVVATLEQALGKTMTDKAVIGQMHKAGIDAVYKNRKDAAAYLVAQDATYRRLIEKLGMMYKKKG